MTSTHAEPKRPIQPLLSVIIPVYNEERTVEALLQRVVTGPYSYPEKEIIVVDDGSRDHTPQILERWANVSGVRLLYHGCNRGKGAAVRSGLAHARARSPLSRTPT